ncbi:holo-ACP synthase [Dermabacteraceae bacterium TAE3-ERU5]|nr:holo-ACP synthase [Dermabacteraceae bacterium TAE3-ERU5]
MTDAAHPPTEGGEETTFLPAPGKGVCGVGIDVVDIAALEGRLARVPALRERLFNGPELALPSRSLAAAAAAKEALGKALGNPEELSWRDVTVQHTRTGRPYFTVRGKVAQTARALGVARLHLSLSHDAGIAQAIVVAERGE